MPTDRVSSGAVLACLDDPALTSPSNASDPDPDGDMPHAVIKESLAAAKLRLGLPPLRTSSYLGRSLPPLPPEDDDDAEWLPGTLEHDNGLLDTTVADSAQLFSAVAAFTGDSLGSAGTGRQQGAVAGASEPGADLSVSRALEMHKGMSIGSSGLAVRPSESAGQDVFHNTVAHLLGVDFLAEDAFWASEGTDVDEVRTAALPQCGGGAADGVRIATRPCRAAPLPGRVRMCNTLCL